MELIRIKKNFQITIPQGLRKKVKIAVGDYVEVDTEKDRIVIRPVKVIPRDQEYFHTAEWQAKEAEADRDIDRDDLVGPFDAVADALKALKTPLS